MMTFFCKKNENEGDFALTPELKTHLKWCITYLMLYLLMYGYSIFRLGLHQDEVYDFNGEEMGLYFAVGRWSLVLWREIFGIGSCLYAAGIVTALLTSVTIVCQTCLLKLTSNVQRAIYGCFYLGCIYQVYVLEYSFQCDAMAGGILAVTAAVALLQQKAGWGRLLMSIACITFAFGTYQATCFYFAALWLACEIRNMQTNRGAGFAKRLTCFIVSGLGAALIWQGIKYALIQNAAVTEEHLNYVRNYHKVITGWDEMLEGTMQEKLAMISSQCQLLFWSLMGRVYTGQWVYATALIPVGVLGLTFLCRKNWLGIVLLLLLWIAPYGLAPVLLRQQPPHTMIAEPVAVACLWGLFAASGYMRPVIYRALIILIPFMLIKSTYTASLKTKKDTIAFQTNISELTQMRYRALQTAAAAGIEAKRILLIGQAPRPLISGYLQHFYLRYMSYDDLMHISTTDDNAQYAAEINQMSDWPAAGSVRVIGDTVLIRMGATAESK